MEYMYELKDKLCDELEEIARKGELGAGDLEIIHKLTDTIKNLDKIEKLEGGYSQAGDWETDGRGSYNRGSSYRNQRRDSRGRYSREYSSARDDMMGRMEELMQGASERDKQVLRRAMSELEK